MPLGTVFFGDYCMGTFGYFFSKHFEMFVLDNPGISDIGVGVIYDGVALIVWNVVYFLLESHRPIFKMAKLVVEKLINFPSENNIVGQRLPMVSISNEVCSCECFYAGACVTPPKPLG